MSNPKTHGATFLLGYFRHINILEFILYFGVLSPLSAIFSRKGFHKNLVFFFVSYFIIVSLIVTHLFIISIIYFHFIH